MTRLSYIVILSCKIKKEEGLRIRMEHYFAPMEGITGYIYRNAHHTFFNHIDKYFTPFIVPSQSKCLAPRELSDVRPEHNEGLYIVPQILTNHAEGFIWAAGELKKLGYGEINLNLGCPSRTVVSKGRGAGFLACPEELDRFLYEIFRIPDMKISVKTRIGKDSPEEFYRLIEIFNRYPMEELIIHPRIQQDYYKNKPNMKVFSDAVALSKNPVCYNGDIFTEADYRIFAERYPKTGQVMLGRGLIANPGLIGAFSGENCLDADLFLQFHDSILNGYQQVMSGDRNVLFKMKELWIYMGALFSDGGKYLKKIKKAERLYGYQAAVEELLKACRLVPSAGYQAD